MSQLQELCETLTAVDSDIVNMARDLHERAQTYTRAAQTAAAAARNQDGTTNHAAVRAASALSAAARATSQAAMLLSQAAGQGQAFVSRMIAGGGAYADVGTDRGAVTPDLQQVDLAALSDYTADGYAEINGALRGSRPMKSAVESRAAAISAALAKLPDFGGEVFRGANLSPAQIDAYVPGQLRTEAGFTSTTSDERSAFAGNVLFFISSKRGKDVSNVSSHPAESEVLFDKGSKFYVRGRSYEPRIGKVVIVLVEV